MKVFNSKLAAIGLAAFVFASCSDSNSDPADGSKINVVDRTTITLASQNVDNSRVVNYKNTTAKARKFFLNTRVEDSSIFLFSKMLLKRKTQRRSTTQLTLQTRTMQLPAIRALTSLVRLSRVLLSLYTETLLSSTIIQQR